MIRLLRQILLVERFNTPAQAGDFKRVRGFESHIRFVNLESKGRAGGPRLLGKQEPIKLGGFRIASSPP